jgi:hypothetical protein
VNHVNEFFSHTNLYGAVLDNQEIWCTNDGGETDVNLWEEAGHHWQATVCPMDAEFKTYDLGACRGPHTALDELNRQITAELTAEYQANQELLEHMAEWDPIGDWTNRMEARQREIEAELDGYDFSEHEGEHLTP